MDEAKSDICKAQYYLNDEVLDKDKPLVASNVILSSLYREQELETKNLSSNCLYKLIRLRIDLCCYFVKNKPLREILEDIGGDFERTFFARTELGGDNEFLPKRAYLSHNGIKYSVYFSEEAKFKVF